MTAAGRRCRKSALAGVGLCPTHAGAQVGPKLKMNDELAARIEQVLRVGGYIEQAAAMVGIGRSTLYEWLKKGESTEPADAPFRQFRERMDAARSQGEMRNVGIIAQAASNNWQAAAWLLERQYPERWARPSQRDKPEEAPRSDPADPFAEVDELRMRRNRGT